MTETQKLVERQRGYFENYNFFNLLYWLFFWSDILERFNITRKKLQFVNINVLIVVELYESLIHYLKEIWSIKSFEKYEDLTKEKSYISFHEDCENWKKKESYIVMRLISDDTNFMKQEDLYINIYIFISYPLLLELKGRKSAYGIISKSFLFFSNIEQLQKSYSKDLGISFIFEVIQF